MNSLQTFLGEFIFRLSEFSWLTALDLLLVTAAFYLMFGFIRRSRSVILVRGALILGVFLFIVSVLLPLPAFDWLVRTFLLGLLIATPIIFQPEIRRFLERVGRHSGLSPTVRQTTTETLVPALVRAIETMADTHTGALIVLEGDDTLSDITETGVPIDGQVTSELLQAIFYPENPLHDGAIVLREDRIIAAGCVLPLTQRLLPARRRLGTRHRAAVGLSESSNALVTVVSEETGTFSVARAGNLRYDLDGAGLRRELFDFLAPTATQASPPPLTQLFWDWLRTAWQLRRLPSLRDVISMVSVLAVAFMLALAVWSFVIEQTVPSKRVLFEGIPLRVEDVPPGTRLVSTPPTDISVIVQTTDSILETLSTSSFQALVSLQDAEPGLILEDIAVTTKVPGVRLVSVNPAAISLELAPIITRTLPVVVEMPDVQNMSPAYEIVGSPFAQPETVSVSGPRPLVEQVSHVQATISVANAVSSLRETRSIRAVNETGQAITGVTVNPLQVQVSLIIQRRLDALTVGVRAVTQGNLPDGYWLSGLTVTPNSLTLRGDRDALAGINGFIDTLPVDISLADGPLLVDVPLDLPSDIQALDADGNLVRSVRVNIEIAARQGDLATSRSVQITGSLPGVTITVAPPRVNLLLSGPLPTLNNIEANPDLVRLLINTGDLTPGESAEIAPQVIAPEEIVAQLVPPTVLVTRERPDSGAASESDSAPPPSQQ